MIKLPQIYQQLAKLKAWHVKTASLQLQIAINSVWPRWRVLESERTTSNVETTKIHHISFTWIFRIRFCLSLFIFFEVKTHEFVANTELKHFYSYRCSAVSEFKNIFGILIQIVFIITIIIAINNFVLLILELTLLKVKVLYSRSICCFQVGNWKIILSTNKSLTSISQRYHCYSYKTVYLATLSVNF